MELWAHPVKALISVRWRVIVNMRPEGWRPLLAYWLRCAACRLDPCWHLLVRIETTPRLSAEEIHECLAQGEAAIERAVQSQATAAGIEQAMQRHCGHLYRDGGRR